MLALSIVAVLAWSARSGVEELGGTGVQLAVGPLLLASLVYLPYVALRGFVWHRMMRWSGGRRPYREDAAIWLGSMLLGRYIPLGTLGSRCFAYRHEAIPVTGIVFCFLLDVGGTVLGACLLALVAGFGFGDSELAALRGALLLPILGVFLVAHPRSLQWALDGLSRATGRARIQVGFGHGQTAAVLAALCAAWFLLGAGVVGAATAATEIPVAHWAYVAGAFAVSHIAGVLAVVVPGGLGVREGLFALALSAILPAGLASVVALVVGGWLLATEALVAAPLLVAGLFPPLRPDSR